jgi:hypothetical protein
MFGAISLQHLRRLQLRQSRNGSTTVFQIEITENKTPGGEHSRSARR